MSLTNADIVELVAFRHDLHRHPELSGEEAETASRVQKALVPLNPQRVIEGLGGHGVAAIFEGSGPAPTLMFRAELDALPIEELGTPPHKSEVPGKGHLCGHDGHMTTLLAFGRMLSRRPPAKGRVILMFQPAEETGAGAGAVIADPRYAEIQPDYAFALHNMPGLPLGHAGVKTGPVAFASRGMRIGLTGKVAHSAWPETGLSPAGALAALIEPLRTLPDRLPDAGNAFTTITHINMGEPAFGISPGEAELFVTLRTLTDDHMQTLVSAAEKAVADTAAHFGLSHTVAYEEVFRHCENDPGAVTHLTAALDAENITCDQSGLPMRASEDFGLFGDSANSAFFLLGSGESHPALHNPDFDFPDDLIPTGARIFDRVVRQMLG